MDKRMGQIIKQIQNNKNLEENIPLLFHSMADHYKTLAKVRLAMHYYTFYETYYDDENRWGKQVLSYVDQLNHIISRYLLNEKVEDNHEEDVSLVDTLRKDIMKQIEVISSYTDLFQTYEYIINRTEYRFVKEAEFVEDEAFAREVLAFIFEPEDNYSINERIKDMIGQLPVRITRQKFFDILKDSIKPYLGAKRSSLDSYIYLLRSTAMLFDESELKDKYPQLWENKEILSGYDFLSIDRNEFDKAVKTLRLTSMQLETEMSVYLGLQEVLNEVYALFLCSPYANRNTEHSIQTDRVENASLMIISKINKVFLAKEKQDILLDVMEEFMGLEGIQEEIGASLDAMEGTFFDLNQKNMELIKGQMLGGFLKVLKQSQLLLSNSLFARLEEESDLTVDETLMVSEAKVLVQDIEEAFRGQSRLMTRAIIANTLNKIPVFFHNQQEVMDYVLYSLTRCSDQYEKTASIEIIREIMSI